LVQRSSSNPDLTPIAGRIYPKRHRGATRPPGKKLRLSTRTHTITLVPGDGIGPEVTAATLAILEAAGAQTGCAFDWHSFDAGADAFTRTGELIPPALYHSIEQNRVALKGPTATPIGSGFSSINVAMRKKFDLYANFRPVKSLPGLKTNYPNLDLVIFRENTEDLYAGLEVMINPDIAQSLKIITRKGSLRIAQAAFEYARKHGRKKIHAIHKANIMKLSDGLFLQCCKQVANEFPDVTYIEHIVDNTCMQLVLNPYQYDIILTTNLYGDILSDLCSAFVGGLGLVPGANLGKDCAIFEAVHGSAPDIAGQDKANPTALLQSAILMLEHLDEFATAAKTQSALNHVYAEGKHLTRDVGGNSGTHAFAQAIIAAL
jgi:isocitrate dehydrogenase (NAD+)